MLSGWWSWGSSEGLVVAGGVDGELSEEFAGGGVDHAYVEVVDEFEYGGSGVFEAHADVVHCAVDSQGEFPVFVDFAVEDSVVGVAGGRGGGFGRVRCRNR